MSDQPDWLGPATDCLKQHGLDEAAQCLVRHDAAIAMLERFVRMEIGRRDDRRADHAAFAEELKAIAEARGETPEEAFARLSPQENAALVPARNPWADAIDIAPLVTREIGHYRRAVEDFLRENHADPEVHEHVVYTAPEGDEPDHGYDRPGSLHFASRGHIHSLIPLATTAEMGRRPTRDEVMAPGSPWPWRLI